MLTRMLRDHVAVSTIGLGCWGMSHAYGLADESESIETIRLALDRGITHLDTADVYGAGHNEALLAHALGARKAEAFIATKFGFVGAEHGQLRIDGSAKYVRAACEASLSRLRVERIDLYYLHRLDPNTPIEETVGAMSELVHEGKARFLGLSEVSAATLRRAHAVHPIAALQSEYSLWSRDVEREVLPACRELGVSLVAFSPLGRGFLTGTVRSRDDLADKDYRRSLPRFDKAHLETNQCLVRGLEKLAMARGATPAQLALAWLLAQGPGVIPIPGMTRRARVIENAAAADLDLSAAELTQLDALAALVQGARHNPHNLQFIES